MKTPTNLRTAARSTLRCLLAGAVALCLAGCIHRSETTYRDSARVKVVFENETAGRVFYEALSKMPFVASREARTDLFIPLVFENVNTVKPGENEKFNEAVRRCDTNQDGIITETEARIFASQYL